MIEVTVLFLDETFSSTAIGPMEVFRHSGTLWNYLTGTRPVPRFRVTTASVDGRAVRCDGPIYIKPDAALSAIRKTDLIFVPTTGISVRRNQRNIRLPSTSGRRSFIGFRTASRMAMAVSRRRCSCCAM